MLYLLWAIPAFIALYVYAWQKRKKALELFVDVGIINRIAISVSHTKRWWKAALLLLAAIFVIIAAVMVQLIP